MVAVSPERGINPLAAASTDRFRADRNLTASARLAGCGSSPAVACLTLARVVYDERLADRIRGLVVGEPGLSEKKMFGGLAFLIGGNMAVGASANGGVMVRVNPAESDTLTATTGPEIVEMRGRPMPGWLRIAAAEVPTDRELAEWVARGTAYARLLPAKR